MQEQVVDERIDAMEDDEVKLRFKKLLKRVHFNRQ